MNAQAVASAIAWSASFASLLFSIWVIIIALGVDQHIRRKNEEKSIIELYNTIKDNSKKNMTPDHIYLASKILQSALKKEILHKNIQNALEETYEIIIDPKKKPTYILVVSFLKKAVDLIEK